MALALLALVVVLLAATAVGSVPIAPGRVLQAIWHGLAGTLQGTDEVIVWQIRLPRVLTAATVGGTLALAGAVFQGIFRNPLADPYLLGVASGAGFGAAVTIAFGATVPLLAAVGLPWIAFAGALLTVALVLLLAGRGGRFPLLSLILAGVVLGSSLSAATSFVMLLSREQAAGVLAWLLGSFGFASWRQLGSVLPLLLLALPAVALSARALDVLQLGEEQARQLGLPVEAVKLALLGASTLMTAAAVSVSGVIGFVGLMVPHAARLLLGPSHRTLLPMSALLGATFMVAADLVARTLISPAEIPVGVVTALVGGPFFLYLLRRTR
jgi:iron complex transport system permease protein